MTYIHIYLKSDKNLIKKIMKNKKIILAAAIVSVVASASSHAKLNGAYVGINGVNVYDDSSTNSRFQGISSAGNVSTNTLGYGIEVGYNVKFNNFLLGAGLSYIYAGPDLRHIKSTQGNVAARISGGIIGHRINLDINTGYSFEDKLALSIGGVFSYNPGKPEYPAENFDKKTTNDFGFGFRIGTNIKLIERISLDVSYRMTWFSTTKDYRNFIKETSKNDVDKVKVSELSRIDKMITAGIRYNF